MKRKIVVALLVVVATTASLFAFSGCGGDGGNSDKQVPVYQGMTISNGNIAKASPMKSNYLASGGFDLLSADNGSYEGDHTDRNDNIDEENPYPDNGAGETIEEEIKSSLNVIGSPDTIYYAEPYQDIYINIHIDNPDSFEIMSFTLNGKKYSSYMFEEGSDMETIVLKYNVGDATGIVEYTIDAIKYIDGTEIKDVIIDGNKTVMAGIRTENQVVASVTDVDIDTNELSFNVNLKDNNALVEFSKGAIKAVIYDGFSIVSEKDITIGDNSVTFGGLKTNTLYQYAVVGYYDDLSGDGFKMNVLYKDAFYTDSVVLFDNISVGQESISFGFLWHEERSDKTLSSLKLYKGDTFVKDLSVSATSLTELLSNTAYKLVAEYLNGEAIESICLAFTTVAKAVPTITATTPTKTDSTINAEFEFTDPDNVVKIDSVKIYKGSALVAENAEKKIAFTGLDPYTEYTVTVAYSYDLNDGNGLQSKTADLTCKTNPHIALNSCRIINTSAVSDGETIYLQATLDNPAGVLPSSVVVNGRAYNCTGSTTANKIFIEIVNDGQFAGGNTTLTIEQINIVIDGVTYMVKTSTNNSGSVFVNGKIEVLKIEFVNGRFEPVNWAFPGEDMYILITLNNPTGYELKNAVANGDSYSGDDSNIKDLTRIDDNRWYYSVRFSSCWNYHSLASLTYYNAYLEKTLTYSNMKTSCYGVASDTVKYISSPDDLLNMDDGYYYELVGDIDLSGREWRGGAFDGVFNGNGYAVRNMSFVGTVLNKSAFLGLFCEGRGVIFDLNIEDATIIAEINSDDGNSYNAYAGGIVAYWNKNLYFANCSIDEYSVISVRNLTRGESCAGGIAGIVWDSTLVGCTNSGSISAANAGGLIGSASNTTLTNCTNRGSISAMTAGGIIGAIWNSAVSDCTNIGSVSAATSEGNHAYAGGIAAFNEGSSFVNCTNIGIINATTTESNCNAIAGGIIGQTHNRSIVLSCTNGGSVCVNASSSSTLNELCGLAGGIVGHASYSLSISYCTNSGSISAVNIHNAYVGGIIGESEGGSTVTGCTNYGDVTATNNAHVGGIVGHAVSTTVTDCTNYADLNVSANFACVGGIVGYAVESSISNCVNFEEIIVTVVHVAYVGGIVGRADSYTSITNCTNIDDISANIVGNVSVGDYLVQIGGIVGAVEGVNPSVSGCTNSGSISTKNVPDVFIGGIGGWLNCSATDCVNSGMISVTNANVARAGGIAGESNSPIVNCINTASVSVMCNHAYIGGMAGVTTSSIEHCVNVGDLSVEAGILYIGAITGEAVYSETNITNCYSLTRYSGKYNGTVCTVDDLNSKNFYNETLGWSEDVWDLSDLDAENGKYPKLK